MSLAAEQITITHKYKTDITPTDCVLRLLLPSKQTHLESAIFSEKIRSQVLLSAPSSMLISSSQTTAPGKETQAPESCLQITEDYMLNPFITN